MRILLVTEQDKRRYIIHAVMSIPEGKTIEQAEIDCETARRLSREANPEEWGYGDVIGYLETMGHRLVEYVESCE